MDNLNLEQINTNNILDNEDFVYTQVKGDDGSIEIIGGGYKVSSSFLKAGLPIMTTTSSSTFDDIQDGGKKVSSPFENLAVPAGLFYINQKMPKMYDNKYDHYESHNMLPDSIFDKLYALVDGSKKANSNKKTRKNRLLKEKDANANATGKRKTKRTHP